VRRRAPAQNNVVVLQRPADIGGAAEQSTMDRIERSIQLPRGADPLGTYDRYYAWYQGADGVRHVLAVYVKYIRSGGEQAERHWVAETDLPSIDDGGCSVISFSYDVAAHRFEHLGCNGYA
jgi:hypothetical protein